MSTRRVPSAPPVIEGFESISLLGSGGFADVFLYEQQRPRRRVAVKVLLADHLEADVQERFDSEANRMAQLSSHPSIVTIYEAGVAAGGRPYLAMEYCSRPSLGLIYRREPLGVAEALRIGIQVAGAVETAHRAGILHRDIKPANILVTEYNRPALTDFGIAATTDSAQTAAEGMSIPWSPPESFAESPRSGVATDIWALAATIYTLLAGRSPFEVPGGANSGADLISRIERSALQPTGRTDVPVSLERVLVTAMAKRAEGRYPTALSLARALQRVETELQLSVTPVDVLDDAPPAPVRGRDVEDDDDEPATRIRKVMTVDPTGYTLTQPSAAMLAELRAGEHTVIRGASGPAASATARGFEETGRHMVGAVPLPFPGDQRAYVPAAVEVAPLELVDTPIEPAAAEEVPSKHRGLGWGAAAALVAAVALGVWFTLGGGSADPAPVKPSVAAAHPMDAVGTVVPAPTNLAGAVHGAEAVFTWVNPAPAAGDTFLWRPVSALGEGTYTATDQPTATTATQPDETCIEVVIRRSGKASPVPPRICAH